jgi:hypothetical protein
MKKKLLLVCAICSLFVLFDFFMSSGVKQGDTADYMAVITSKRLINVGWGAYGIRNKNWECRKFLASMDNFRQINLAFLWDSFGENNDCLLSVMNDPRLKNLEVILFNEVCQRNRNCASHEFLAGISTNDYENALLHRDQKTMRRIKRYMNKVVAFFALNLKPTTQLFVSPGLESNLSGPAMHVLVRLASRLFPGALMIENPESGGSNYSAGATFREYHGTGLPNPWRPCVTDLDGLDINFPERPSTQHSGWMQSIDAGRDLQDYIGKAARECEFVLLWTREMNCYNMGANPEKYRSDPAERPCNSGIVMKLMADQILIAQNTKR